jgi:hypothetical protein
MAKNREKWLFERCGGAENGVGDRKWTQMGAILAQAAICGEMGGGHLNAVAYSSD